MSKQVGPRRLEMLIITFFNLHKRKRYKESEALQEFISFLKSQMSTKGDWLTKR